MEKETKLTLRSYQLEAIGLVKSKNVIVNLDTGLGKTLIAVGAIDYHLHSYPTQKILLVVPTVELVLQQAEYCRTNCRTIPAPRVKEVKGVGDNWGEKQWRESKASFAIFVGTAQAILSAFGSHYLVTQDFSLLIFDECHNAVGQSPAACLLRDYVHPAYGLQERGALGQGCVPRILGLTASFVNGAVKDLEKKRSVLEALMLATLWAPKEEDLKPFIKPKMYKEIVFDPFESELAELFVEKLVSQLFDLFKDVVPVRDVDKVIRWGLHVLSNLGLSGFMYFAAKCLVVQLEDKLKAFRASNLGWNMTNEDFEQRIRYLNAFRVVAREKPQDLIASMGGGYMNAFPLYTCKFQKALDLLDQLRLIHAKKFKGLIFLEQKSATTPMSHLINEYFGERLSAPISRALTQSKRKKNMEDFREGRLAILVTTPALEEGIDVSNCLFVIRFDGFHTTKSHIQGSGRARFEEAEIYYFENSIDAEKEKEREMRRIALDESLNLSDDMIEDELARGRDMKAQGRDVYPIVHPVSNCAVTISNCITLFNEYFQKVMKQSPPQEIFVYETVEVRRFPPEKVKTLCQVIYPSPNGIQNVYKAEVDAYWGTFRFEDLVPIDTIKNLKAIDRDKRRFVLFVMKTMLERGYVTEYWKASAEAIKNTKSACPSYLVSSELRIKNSYQ